MIDPNAHTRMPSYLLISPTRDEASYAQRTLDSVLAQTLTPAMWIIVDDGSTDETPELLARYAARYPFIYVIKKTDRGERRVGPGVIHAFNEGLRLVSIDRFDYLCKLDLDLDLPPRYFESMIQRMQDNPRLGSFSGRPYARTAAGQLLPEPCGDDMSVGMTKFYRTACFRDIGGFHPQVMWDGIDCHHSRLCGWQVRSADSPDLRFLHLRPMGSSDRNVLRGRLRHGFGQYYMGTRLIYLLASSLYRVSQPPRFVGSMAILWGYLRSCIRREPTHPNTQLQRLVRRYQTYCLLLGKRRAMKRIESEAESRPRDAFQKPEPPAAPLDDEENVYGYATWQR